MSTSTTARIVSRRSALAGLGGLGLALTSRGLASAQDASPAADYRMQNHLVIGPWRWANGGGTYISFGTFFDDGRYVEVGPGGFVGIGAWRPTGERTAEFVITDNVAGDLSATLDPHHQVPQECRAVPNTTVWRFMTEIDGTGNHMTGAGAVEVPDGNGGVTVERHVSAPADRLMIGSDTTPTG